MFDAKYRLTEIADRKRYNPLYEAAEGSVCYLAYFKTGERGWFLYEVDDDFLAPVHRMHTSEVQNVEFTENGGVIVKTKNATYKFALIIPGVEENGEV